MAMFTPPLDSASAMSRIRARSGTHRRGSPPAVGAWARQQRLIKGLLQALHLLGAGGLALLRQRPERQRRPSALSDRVLKLTDGHIEIAQALLDQRGLWPAVDFVFQPLHLRTENAPALSLELGI